MIERQEIYCHACGNYVQFNMDVGIDGNHVLNCPKCDHEHCRVVKNGIITSDRWDSRNGATIQISTAGMTVSISSIATSMTDLSKAVSSMTSSMAELSSFLADSWNNTESATGT